MYEESGKLDEFHAARPNISERQQKIIYAFYDLRREIESGKRIPSRDITEAVKSLMGYENDCAKVIIQSIDDFYIELYFKKLKQEASAK